MVERLVAPAKLTVSLRIVGTRKDGMHLIEAEMVSVSLADELRMSGVSDRGSGTALHVEIDSGGLSGEPEPASAPSPSTGAARRDVGEDIPTGQDNLVLRALDLVGLHPREVHLLKRIPAGAGLGGGSSDAAAVLRWAGWDDLEAAAALGADIPFCLLGGRASVSGVGEVVEPLDFRPTVFTLVTPPVHCSTPRVYSTWDEMGGPTGRSGNDLEGAAVRAFPELVEWRDRLEEKSGVRPCLAGSGGTWFVEGAFPEAGLVVEAVPANWDGEATYLLRDAGNGCA